MLAGPPPALNEVCGPDPSYICKQLLDLTESERAAETADLVLAKPFSILLILVVAWIVLVLVHRAIDRFVGSLSSRVADSPVTSARAAARTQTLGHLLQSIAAFVVWTVALVTILGELGINLGPLIAGAGIAGLALGFGAQSLVRDFLAGIFILVEDQYGVGDTIDVGDLSGTRVAGIVESVTLRTTRLRGADGTVWYVPNGTVQRVGNLSQGGQDPA